MNALRTWYTGNGHDENFWCHDGDEAIQHSVSICQDLGMDTSCRLKKKKKKDFSLKDYCLHEHKQCTASVLQSQQQFMLSE